MCKEMKPPDTPPPEHTIKLFLDKRRGPPPSALPKPPSKFLNFKKIHPQSLISPN